MRTSTPRFYTSIVCLIAASLGCRGASKPGDVNADRVARADETPGNWYTLGRDNSQGYFSPLRTIDSSNISRLGYAWSYDLGTVRGQEATPIVVDGVMYTAGYVGLVYALDAATGKELWRFDPQVPPKSMREPCCDLLNRGVAVWEGRVYVASVDGKLHALDAATGKEIWAADTFIDHAAPYSSTGAPIVAHNVVVIGNSGADMGKGGVRGYVSAYDLATGALKWRFFTVPPAVGKPFEHPEVELASKTWAPGRDSVYAGGATVWDGMTYDPGLNLLYFGTGNAAPYDVRKLGAGNGDMLFAAAIVAVNPDDGRMAWYYQTTPGDKWDYDATQKLVLADLTVDGKPVQVVMQANKNGYFYVIERKTGHLVSAKGFTYMNWSSGIDEKTGRPIVAPEADYYGKPRNIFPSAIGAHTWQPMSFDPITKLVYIPVLELPNILFILDDNHARIHYINGGFNMGMVSPDATYDPKALKSLYGALPDAASIKAAWPGKKMVRETLIAWDPVAGKKVWEQETSSSVRRSDGGALSTAGGLVFQGRGDGTMVAYSAMTGTPLKTIQTGSHIMAAPITYAVNGVQYVAVQTGFGGGSMTITGYAPTSAATKYGNENRIVVFRLDGGEVPLPPAVADVPFPEPPPSKADKTTLAHGEIKFVEQCSRCHVFTSNVTPDLRKLRPEFHAQFNNIVLGGMFGAKGMEKFDDLLTPADVDAIHAYLIDLQRQGYEEQKKR